MDCIPSDKKVTDLFFAHFELSIGQLARSLKLLTADFTTVRKLGSFKHCSPAIIRRNHKAVKKVKEICRSSASLQLPISQKVFHDGEA